MKLQLAPSLTIALAGIALATASCGIGGGGKMVGSGPTISNDRMLTSFSEIEVDGPMNVTIMQGSAQRVNVTAQLDVQPLLKTTIKGSKLTISLAAKVDPSVNTNVEIIVADLSDLDVDGSGNIRVEGFSGKKFSLDTDGSGNVELRNVRYDKVESDQSGSGDVTFMGEGDELTVSVSGSGDFTGNDFTTDKVKVTAKGSGEVRVVANSTLNIDLSGSGNVYYRGNPKLEISDKGSGEAKAEN